MNKRAAWIGGALSVVAVVVLLWRVDLRELASAVARANPVWLVPSLVSFFVMFTLRAWRWSLLMGGTNVRDTYHANIIGYMFNASLPLRIGELARAYVVSKKCNVSMARALSAVVVERLVDLATVLVLFAIFTQLVPMPASFARAATMATVAILVSVVVGGLLVLRGDAFERFLEPRTHSPRARRWLARFDEVRASFRAIGSPRRLAQCFVLTVVLWFVTILIAGFCMQAFMPADLAKAGLVVVTANLGGALPSAPGGLGIVQGFATTALVVPFGVPESDALAFVLAWSLGAQVLLVVLGVVSMWRIGLGFREIREGTARKD